MINKVNFPKFSIGTRLVVYLGIVFVFVAALFIGSNKVMTNSINTEDTLDSAERDVEVLLNMFNLKYLTSQTLADDYSYWRSLFNLVHENSNNADQYDRLLGHLVDSDFVYIGIHNLELETLYEKTALTLGQGFSIEQRYVEGLKVFGDIAHRMEKQGNEIYIVSYRPVFSDSFDINPAGYLTLVVALGQEFLKQMESMVSTKFRFVYDKPISEDLLFLRNYWSPTVELEKIDTVSDEKAFTFRVFNQGSPTSVKILIIRPSEHDRSDEHTMLLIIQLLILALIALFVFALIRKYVSSPLLRMSHWLKEIDVSEPNKFVYEYDDEIGRLADNIFKNQSRFGESIKVHNNLLNAISDVIITIDERYLITYCNPKAEAWLGLDSNSIVGQDIDFLIQLEKGCLQKLICESQCGHKEHACSIRVVPFHKSPIEYLTSTMTITKFDDSRHTMLMFRFDI